MQSSNDTPEFCVGQQVNFVLNGLPGSVNMVGNWNLPGEFVNQPYAYSSTCTSYDINNSLLQNTNQTSCWFINKPGGTVSVGMNLLFSNGQSASIAADGSISVYRPSYSNFSTANTLLGSYTNSPRTFLWDGNILSYGDAATGEHGQYWSVEVDSKYNGAIGILQLVNALYTQNYGWCPDCRDTLDTGGDFWLDGSPTSGYYDPNNYEETTYYTNYVSTHTVALGDQPAEELWAASPINVRLWGQFKDYLRFQPNGANSIAVTLATNGWSMEGMATVTSGIVTNSTPVPSGLSDSDQFPIWTQIKSSK